MKLRAKQQGLHPGTPQLRVPSPVRQSFDWILACPSRVGNLRLSRRFSSPGMCVCINASDGRLDCGEHTSGKPPTGSMPLGLLQWRLALQSLLALPPFRR